MRVLQRVSEDIDRDLGDAIAEARAAHDLLWIDLEALAPEVLLPLSALLGLRPGTLHDVLSRVRPALALSDEHLHCSLVTIRTSSDGSGLVAGRVTALIGDGVVVTVGRDAGEVIARAQGRLAPLGEDASALAGLHALLQAAVDDFEAASAWVETALLASADRLFAERPTDEARVLYGLTRDLLALAHAVQPLIEPLRHLSAGTVEGLGDGLRRRFEDVLDAALVVDREIGDHTALLEHLRGSNDSRIGRQQNSDMRKIAAWAAVVAVPTAVTGFYGMNVPYPGFGEGWGALTAVVVQTVAVLVLVVVFRRRGWL